MTIILDTILKALWVTMIATVIMIIHIYRDHL